MRVYIVGYHVREESKEFGTHNLSRRILIDNKNSKEEAALLRESLNIQAEEVYLVTRSIRHSRKPKRKYLKAYWNGKTGEIFINKQNKC